MYLLHSRVVQGCVLPYDSEVLSVRGFFCVNAVSGVRGSSSSIGSVGHSTSTKCCVHNSFFAPR